MMIAVRSHAFCNFRNDSQVVVVGYACQVAIKINTVNKQISRYVNEARLLEAKGQGQSFEAKAENEAKIMCKNIDFKKLLLITCSLSIFVFFDALSAHEQSVTHPSTNQARCRID